MTVEIYTKTFCPYCWRAKALLEAKGVEYREIPVDYGGELREQMIQRANGRTTVPQIFIREHHVGGCDDLLELDRSGGLDDLIRVMTRIALFQSTTGIDPAANARCLEQAIAEAAEGGAEILFTPEMSGLLDRNSARAAKNLREESEDEVLAACREAARRHRIWLHLGSLAVLAENGRSRTAVSSSIAKAKFALATTSSTCSTSIFRPVRVGGNPTSILPGSGVVLVNGTPVGKLGLTICYDLRFPGLFARLAEANADIIAVPAAFTVPTGKAHWHVLLRARAIEAGSVRRCCGAGWASRGRPEYFRPFARRRSLGRGSARYGR